MKCASVFNQNQRIYVFMLLLSMDVCGLATMWASIARFIAELKRKCHGTYLFAQLCDPVIH